MLRIYGYAASINVRKVLWTCAELGLDFERDDWPGRFRPTSDRAFLSLNPVGMVPVIDDDGIIIWESNTIVRYLAASRGRVELLPTDPGRRAQIEMWMDWQASDFNNSWRVAYEGLAQKNPDHQEPSAIERSMASRGWSPLSMRNWPNQGVTFAGHNSPLPISPSVSRSIAGDRFRPTSRGSPTSIHIMSASASARASASTDATADLRTMLDIISGRRREYGSKAY